MSFVDPTIVKEKYTQGYPVDTGKECSVKDTTAASVFEYGKTAESFYKSENDGFFMQDAVYGRPGGNDNETILEQLESQIDMSADNRKNQMIVVTNTASAEDLQEMEKNGFSGLDADSHTILSVTDKIKIALAKAGVDISDYGSSFSKEELEAAIGNSAIANQIMSALQAANLPVTEDNLAESITACETAEKIQPLDNGSKEYLVKNHYEPTIQNLYMAMFSGAEMVKSKESEIDFSALESQMEQIIRDAGLEVNTQTKEECCWLIERGISLTATSLIYLESLNVFSENLKDSEGLEMSFVMDKITEAIRDGKRPMEALLIEGYSIMDKARAAMDVITEATDEDLAYCVSEEMNISVDNLKTAQKNRGYQTEHIHVEITADIRFIKAKRQLEETRLAMTLEANYALIKRGIAIDTKPLEQLVEDLKNQEQLYYKALLTQSGVEATEQNTRIFTETTMLIEELKYQPAYVLQTDSAQSNIRSLHQAGTVLKNAMETAIGSYETLWTIPRADMGDSIQKAFANVDDILKDLNLETSELNQRAVRILAYNQTEITEENILKIKEADSEVQRLFKNLTPSVTLEMIRRGENPLDIEISKLNHITEEIQSEQGEKEEERFSKYLWKLEQNHEITEEERSSYIGIYRLITQVEKTDGAAIGALLNQGADITMRNLLTAVRSAKKGINYRVNDSFAGVENNDKVGKIDNQIMSAFQNNCVKEIKDMISPEALSKIENWEEYTPEQFMEALQQAVQDETVAAAEHAYYTQMAAEYSSVLKASDEVYAFLEKYDMKNSARNVQAIAKLMDNPSYAFDILFSGEGKSAGYKEMMAEMKNTILKQFGEAVKTPQEMAEAQNVLAEVAEHTMQGMIVENESVSVKDIKDLRLMSQQLFLCGEKAKEESFLVPVQTGDSVTGISLKIVRGKENKGLVNIFFRGTLMEKVAASFEAKENGVSGIIATTDENTKQLLTENMGLLAGKINADGQEPFDVNVTCVSDLSMWQFEKTELSETGERTPVQTKRLYHIAESFIQTISEISK